MPHYMMSSWRWKRPSNNASEVSVATLPMHYCCSSGRRLLYDPLKTGVHFKLPPETSEGICCRWQFVIEE